MFFMYSLVNNDSICNLEIIWSPSILLTKTFSFQALKTEDSKIDNHTGHHHFFQRNEVWWFDTVLSWATCIYCNCELDLVAVH